jgi:hypothetical protein
LGKSSSIALRLSHFKACLFFWQLYFNPQTAKGKYQLEAFFSYPQQQYAHSTICDYLLNNIFSHQKSKLFYETSA